MTATQKTFRISKLEVKHMSMNIALTATGQTLAQLASAVGIAQDLAERQLSILVDEALATASTGSRAMRTYQAVA